MARLFTSGFELHTYRYSRISHSIRDMKRFLIRILINLIPKSVRDEMTYESFNEGTKLTREYIAERLVKNRGRFKHYVRGATQENGKHTLYRVILRSMGEHETVLVGRRGKGKKIIHTEPELLF